jgi:hypothetical protein
MPTVLIRCLLCAVIILSAACERVPPLVEYESSGAGLTQQIASVPIVIVGRILAHSEVGHPHPSRWDAKYPMQLYKVTVQVENILRGDVKPGIVPIFYFANLYVQ